jgi:hypothetical protein
MPQKEKALVIGQKRKCRLEDYGMYESVKEALQTKYYLKY